MVGSLQRSANRVGRSAESLSPTKHFLMQFALFITGLSVWECALVARGAPPADTPAQPQAEAPGAAKSSAAKDAAANPDTKAADPKPADAKAVEGKADAKPGARPVGHLIRVPVPIEGNVDLRVRSAVHQLLGKIAKGGPRPVLVFEFTPETEDGKGSDFSRALGLAEFIAVGKDLSGVKTVAYIPKTIKGHAVLVAMACEEIIMAPNAEIGDAGIDETVIGPTIRSGYKEIADARKNIPPALALGMLDKDLKVLKVLTEQGTDIILSTDLEELEKHRSVLKPPEELAPVPGLYSGERGRSELGFVTFKADSRQDVANELGLAPDDLRDDPSLGGAWKPVRIPIRGVITNSLITETQSKIRDQIENHEANFICLWIDSAGGSPIDSQRLAGYLADLDPAKVRTVAYVPQKARGDASLIAVACDQIVAGPEASLGGSGESNMPADEILQIDSGLKDIAKKKGISWSTPVAMVDPTVKIYRYMHRDQGLEEYLSPEEVAVRPDAAAWVQGDLVWQGGSPWLLSGQRAKKYGLVWNTVDNFNEFKQLYNLENDVALVEPGWADFLISALSSPSLLGILMFLGLAGVVAELYSPGLGIGGFVAIVAFMLYFWILHLHGTAGWLEVLLFLAGVGCLLLEIFVLPGFAIFGLGGGLMIIASLVLASQTFILPRNDYQWEQMQTTLVSLGGAVVGTFVAAVAFRRFLPHAPVFNRVFLQPPSGEERQTLASRESMVDFAHLVGRTGTTATPLMPSGKARFGDELLDVIADGEAIDRGQTVVVVEVRGNRVLVHRVSA